MVRVFGIVFIAIIASIPIVLVDSATGSGFVVHFAREQSSGIIGTILALNVATVTYLVSSLLSIEKEAGQSLFHKTKSEIKQNVYFMGAALVTNLFIVSFINESRYLSHKHMSSPDFFPAWISLVLFILVVAAVLEIVQAVFKLSHFVVKKSNDD